MKVRLIIGNAETKVEGLTPTQYRELSIVLSYEAEQFAVFQFRRRRPGFKWDGRIRLMDRGHFPTGLLPLARKYFAAANMLVSEDDQRLAPKPCLSLRIRPGLIEDRPYQLEALLKTDSEPRGVFVHGVGAGKTTLAARIIVRKRVPTLFIAPGTDIRDQTLEVYREMFGTDKVSADPTDRAAIVVSNIQGLTKQKPGTFDRFGMVFFDEVHHSASNEYRDFNRKFLNNVYYRYGLTGTFLRNDNKDLEMYGVMSKVLHRITASELIDLEYLVRPHITMFITEGEKLSGSFNEVYDQGVVENGIRNRIIADTAKDCIKRGKQTLILVRKIEHGHILSRLIPGFAFVHGQSEDRRQMRRDFAEGRQRGLIATNIFGEGTNIPSIEALINARSGQSEIETTQGIGRALRRYKNKEKAEIYDFIDMQHQWLARHSKSRLETYEKEPAFRVKLKRPPTN